MLAAIKATLAADRKPANIMLVIDTSRSMEDEGRLASAKQGVAAFLDQVGPKTTWG